MCSVLILIFSSSHTPAAAAQQQRLQTQVAGNMRLKHQTTFKYAQSPCVARQSFCKRPTDCYSFLTPQCALQRPHTADQQ